MLQKQIVQKFTCGTLAVKHEDWILFQLLKWNLLLFQIEVGRIRNENIGKIADCFLNIGMVQMCIWEVRHDQVDFALL